MIVRSCRDNDCAKTLLLVARRATCVVERTVFGHYFSKVEGTVHIHVTHMKRGHSHVGVTHMWKGHSCVGVTHMWRGHSHVGVIHVWREQSHVGVTRMWRRHSPFFIFMQFSGKFSQIIGWRPFEVDTPSGKSWIRHRKQHSNVTRAH